jgi:hypothetical protein
MGIASAMRRGSGHLAEVSQLRPVCRTKSGVAYDQLNVFYSKYVAYAQISGGARWPKSHRQQRKWC